MQQKSAKIDHTSKNPKFVKHPVDMGIKLLNREDFRPIQNFSKVENVKSFLNKHVSVLPL